MFLRRCYRNKDGKRHAYWALVESYRTARGPRQRMVAWLGEMDERGRLAIRQREARNKSRYQHHLFDDEKPEWIEVDLKRIAVEKTRKFGGPWIGLELLRRLGLDAFITETMQEGREEVPWAIMAMVLVLGRLCDPSSELRLAEQVYESSAMSELLGVPADKVNDDRLYRALDRLLPHKKALEKHLKQKLGELFPMEYDLLLYDVTSTYFEGESSRNELAQRGYSRDRRPDCKQVNIALVVSRYGMPVGYEVFAGNRHDAKTVEQVVEHVEKIYGRANRIWVMDRGMVSESNVAYLRKGGRRYIVGTAKSQLRKYEKELLSKDWKQVHDGLQVRICPAPDGREVFILCRSLERQVKEQAMHERFERRIEEGLEKIAASCRRSKQKPLVIATRVGRLMGKNTRSAGLFQVQVKEEEGAARIEWIKLDSWREWARLSEGCYMLRSNVTDWTPEELWRAYIQLTEAEAAFRIQKSDLQIRPVWHQRTDRVQAHILVCFLAYVLWKALAQMCLMAGLGNEPRKVFESLSEISLVDVLLPTQNGITIRKRCVSRPTQHQAILLQKLKLRLPSGTSATRACPRSATAILGRRQPATPILCLLLASMAVILSRTDGSAFGEEMGRSAGVFFSFEWSALRLFFGFGFTHFALIFPIRTPLLNRHSRSLLSVYLPYFLLLGIAGPFWSTEISWAVQFFTMLAGLLFGLTVLIRKYFFSLTSAEKNRLRVVLIGCLAGALPIEF